MWRRRTGETASFFFSFFPLLAGERHERQLSPGTSRAVGCEAIGFIFLFFFFLFFSPATL